jgi:hypothetical protein
MLTAGYGEKCARPEGSVIWREGKELLLERENKTRS